ncbi:MAG: N-acetylmuramic acid 6-phosphate etherase [Planctomycetota bacterium]|nr:N-acetylmuramic acid 6-phosphate etherase [Planctomycetota bacterium]
MRGDREDWVTEQINERTKGLDKLGIEEILRRINEEDRFVVRAVESVIPTLAKVVERVVESFRSGGRLFYVGAGTSGRLGVLDASEIPPTFGESPERVQGIVAGGTQALHLAVEGAEDDLHSAVDSVAQRDISTHDVVIGITCSGRTPFVLAALEEAGRRGALRVLLTVNPVDPESVPADWVLAPVVGPEVIAGSTRMKGGTATKLILNMITTTTMVCLGKVFGNLMVDLQPTNQKLVQRAVRMISGQTGLDEIRAQALLEEADGHVKTALAMHQLSCGVEEARRRLESVQGFLGRLGAE